MDPQPITLAGRHVRLEPLTFLHVPDLFAALMMDRDRQHIVTTRVEHSATLKTCEALAKRGYEITWLGVDSSGQIDLHELERAIRPDTAIVSVMWANNETGVLSPIREIAEIVHKKKTLFHTDAVQAVGKIPINLAHLPINFLSISGHKLHCPKGVGVLYVSRRTRFNPMMIGGGQEQGRRSGTEAVPNIVGLGRACQLAKEFTGRDLDCLIRIIKHIAAIGCQQQLKQIAGETTSRLDDREETFRGQIKTSQNPRHMQNDFTDQPVIAICGECRIHRKHLINVSFGANANQSDFRFVHAQIQQCIIKFTIYAQRPVPIAQFVNFIESCR